MVSSHLMEMRPNTIIFVASDHGDVQRLCYQQSPMLHLIVPQALLQKRPDLETALRGNREELVSGWDLFATLLHVGVNGGLETKECEIEF